MPRRRALAAALASLLAAPVAARAEDPRMLVHPEKAPAVPVDRTDEEGVLAGKRTESLTGHVRSVDLGKRQVVLRLPEDRVETIEVGPEVEHLERLERGDRVNLRYRVGLVLRPVAPGSSEAAAEVEKQIKRTGRGDVLSGTETVSARLGVAVAAVDAASRTVTLQDAGGRTYRAVLGPGVALDRVKVGDRFTATWSAAMALSVEPTGR
jgi:hypothetical protein